MRGKIMSVLRIQFSLLLTTLSVIIGENGESRPFYCTSPCQYASDADGDSNIVPCVITNSCLTSINRESVSTHLAPSAPLDVVIRSSNETADDGHVYLSISPEWHAPLDRIGLLTGFQVNTMCNKSPCVSAHRCVTVTFNRTLTTADALSKFSLECQFWNFSQPDMEYVTIVKSLPLNEDNSNMQQNRTTLPSCDEVPEVSMCKIDSNENWEPSFGIQIVQIANGSISVTIWPTKIGGKFPKYDISLIGWELMDHQTKTLVVQESAVPAVCFNITASGTYEAWVIIHDCTNCRIFRSQSYNFTYKEPTVITVAPSEATTLKNTDKPKVRISGSTKKEPNSLSLAAIAGAMGGCLGLLLLSLLGYLTCKHKCRVVSRHKAEKEKGYIDDQHEEDDFFDVDMGSKIYETNNHHSLIGIDNPSMIPQTIHNDLDKPNGILLHESNHYANIIGRGKGDSISTIAIDIHASQNGWMSTKLIPCRDTEFTLSPVSLDSGVELASSDMMEGDDETLVLSLALKEDLGESV